MMIKRQSIEIILILTIVFFATLCSNADTDIKTVVNTRRIEEKVGDMLFDYNQVTGLALSLNGTSVITSSSLCVVSPEWVEKYFLSTFESEMKEVMIEDIDCGKRITIFQSSSTDPTNVFSGKQIFTLFDDNTIVFEVEIRYDGDNAAIFENKVAGINAILIAGREFIATKDGKKTEGVIPFLPVGSNAVESMVSRNFEKITIDSRLGKIEIHSNIGDDISFFDYRGNMWAQAEEPMFWLGHLDQPLEKNRSVYCKTVIRLPKIESEIEAISVTANIEVDRTDFARVSKWGNDYIIPTPKSIVYNKSSFSILPKTRVYIGEDYSNGINNAINYLREDFENYFGIDLSFSVLPEDKDIDNAIILGGDFAADICSSYGISTPAHQQGYGLVAADDVVAITSNSDAGIFNGVMTLLQLVAIEEGRIFIKGASIYDYPALDMRGVHFFSGKDTSSQTVKMIRDVLARFKINTLLWQCDYVNWDSMGVHHSDIGMPKEQAKEVISAASKNNLEFIPLLATLGHMEWMFKGGKNIELAEDPQTPYAYCPTNPATYDYIFGVFTEILDFLGEKPRIFHIGHDEVTMIGRFPYRSKDSGMGVTDLLMYDIDKLHSWFSERDIRIGLWGDMFLAPDEASSSAFAPNVEESKKRRDSLPKDVMVFDWHYENNAPEKFVSLSKFIDDGFEVVASTWFNPDNIRNMSKAAVDNNLTGLMQTTWAGYNFRVDGNEAAWFQYWAYIWAAQYAWTGQCKPNSELDFSASDTFCRIWREDKPNRLNKPGHLFDLSHIYNLNIREHNPNSGFGVSITLPEIPVDKVLFNDINYLIKPSADGMTGILMAGNLINDFDTPDVVSIMFDPIKASSLCLLMSSTLRVQDGTKIGCITLKYDDVVESVDIIYGHNVFAFNDARASSKSRAAWRGRYDEQEVFVNEMIIDAESDSLLNSISLQSLPSDSAMVLIAVTVVE